MTFAYQIFSLINNNDSSDSFIYSSLQLRCRHKLRHVSYVLRSGLRSQLINFVPSFVCALCFESLRCWNSWLINRCNASCLIVNQLIRCGVGVAFFCIIFSMTFISAIIWFIFTFSWRISLSLYSPLHLS